MLIPSLALITILFLLLVWATIRERVMAKEIKLAKQFYAAIWNNAHEFIFLIQWIFRYLPILPVFTA